ncbi:MAG: carboxypeptidase-like regulatory domain-containing protein [bacterium]|nr:carboxypeptidase-like regulatory domain-containing protein [bacterium]
MGVQGGSPAGKLLADKIVLSGSLQFNIKTSVHNVDDSFDGTAGGNPNDTSPADYKLAEVEITCLNCTLPLNPVIITTTIAPPGLETDTKKGSLFINALNASGQPISNASVTVVNNQVIPAIDLNGTTNTSGQFKLVDTATSSGGYEITVGKSGYSSDKTHLIGDPLNPNPLKSHATVIEDQVTETSFIIDQLSSLHFKTRNYLCNAVPNIDFLQEGTKLIGIDPDTPKYSESLSTDASGDYANNATEWDTYDFTNQDGAYDISGISNPGPLIINPAETKALTWTMKLKNPSALLVVVEDENGQLVNDANVTLSKSGFSASFLSGHSSISFTDWSGNEYDSKSPNIETDNPAGQITLVDLGGGKYASDSQEFLISETVDFGTQQINPNKISWLPISQPAQTGADSLKFQLAANNDNSVWNFAGPDGTANSYYTSDTNIYSGLAGNRYLRYKAYLQTADDAYTPSLDYINMDFSSECVGNGQAFFNGLATGTYTLTIQKTGYQIFTDTLNISDNWQQYTAELIP